MTYSQVCEFAPLQFSPFKTFSAEELLRVANIFSSPIENREDTHWRAMNEAIQGLRVPTRFSLKRFFKKMAFSTF